MQTQTTNTAPPSPNSNHSFISHYKTELFNLAYAALSEDVSGNEEAGQLQSIIGMVHSLVEEKRINDLDAAIREHFPEYYLDSPGHKVPVLH